MDAITLSTGRIIVLNEDEAVEVQNYFLRKADKEQCREYLEKMQNKLIHLDSGFAIIDENANRIRATVVAPGTVHYSVDAKIAGYEISLVTNGEEKADPVALLKRSGLCKAMNTSDCSFTEVSCNTNLTDGMYHVLLEGNILRAQKMLDENGPVGAYQDADTILADMTGDCIRYGYEDSGIFEKIVQTILSVPNRRSAEAMFRVLTGWEYREILDEIVKRIGMPADT